MKGSSNTSGPACSRAKHAFQSQKTPVVETPHRTDVYEPPLRRNGAPEHDTLAILDRVEAAHKSGDEAKDREIAFLKRQIKEQEETHAAKSLELNGRITSLRAELKASKLNGSAPCADSARSNIELSRRIMHEAMHAAGLNAQIGALLEELPSSPAI